MSDTKWTPGPYVCRSGEAVTVRTQGCGQLAILSHIKNPLGRRNPDEVVATGKLFAAAPDLYEALEVLLNLHDHNVFTKDAWVVSMEEARAALAKARGEV